MLFRSGAMNLGSTALTLVETIAFNASGNSLTVNTADLADVTTITGGVGTDTLRLADADTALNLAGKTITSLNGVQLGAGGDTLTVDATIMDGVRIVAITGGAGSDTLQLTGGMSLNDQRCWASRYQRGRDH